LNWQGLLVRSYRHPAQHQELRIPVLAEDVIILHLNPPMTAECRLGQQWQSACAVPGTVSIIPRGLSSCWTWDRAAHFLYIFLSPSLLRSAAESMLNATDVDVADIELVSRVWVGDAMIRQIGLKLKCELESGDIGNRFYIESLVQTLAVHLIREHSTLSLNRAVRSENLPASYMKQALDYIKAHLSEELRIADIASQSHFSLYEFIRRFKQSMGISPYQYVLQQRVERAQQLLSEQPDLAIADIALQCGFSNQSHLSKQFRQLAGMTPMGYRAQYI
jgi:AraC family transcriptional regulator